MSAIVQTVLATLGAAVGLGGGLVAISYALFRFFGEKWINAKFEERLAAYKHAQQKELEELRFKINALMDRATKLHQREFDVLPDAWAKLIDAHGITIAITSAFQRYPDFDQMSGPHLDEFLAASPLANWQKDEIKGEAKKGDYYIQAIAWHKITAAREAIREFHIFFRKNLFSYAIPSKRNLQN